MVTYQIIIFNRQAIRFLHKTVANICWRPSEQINPTFPLIINNLQKG